VRWGETTSRRGAARRGRLDGVDGRAAVWRVCVCVRVCVFVCARVRVRAQARPGRAGRSGARAAVRSRRATALYRAAARPHARYLCAAPISPSRSAVPPCPCPLPARPPELRGRVLRRLLQLPQMQRVGVVRDPGGCSDGRKHRECWLKEQKHFNPAHIAGTRGPGAARSAGRRRRREQGSSGVGAGCSTRRLPRHQVDHRLHGRHTNGSKS